MVYQLIIDGKKYGQYSLKATPANTSKKMAKMIYMMNKFEGNKELIINFCKNRTIEKGDDLYYTYKVYIEVINDPHEKYEMTKEQLEKLLNEGKEKEIIEVAMGIKPYIKKNFKKIKNKYILQKYIITAKRM